MIEMKDFYKEFEVKFKIAMTSANQRIGSYGHLTVKVEKAQLYLILTMTRPLSS